MGMLWYGKDVEEAVKYYTKKYNRKPNEVEIHPSSKLLDGKKVCHFDGYDLVASKVVLVGNMVVGCKEDEDLKFYGM